MPELLSIIFEGSCMSYADYYSEKPRLPEHFADTLLEMEIKADSEECDLKTVQKLNELYRIAIEYYIAVDTKKTMHFQKKLTALLTNPTTLRLIDNRPQKPIQRVTSQARLHPEQQTLVLNNQLERFRSQPKTYVKSILDNNQKKLQHTQSIIREGISKQQDNIRNRVLERVRSRNKC